MSEDTGTALGTVFLGCAASSAILFLLVYAIGARWWETREGWYLLASSLAFSVILSFNFSVVQGWIQASSSTWVWCRLVIYAMILVVMAWRPVLLVGAQAGIWHVRKRKQRQPSSEEQK